MRDGLTLFAAILIAVLSLALVVPYCVDWTVYRSALEAELSETVGVAVLTRGRLDIALLPIPHISLGHVEAGDNPTTPALVLDDVELEVSITDLLHGEVHFHDVTLAHPRFRLVLQRDGSFAIPAQWRSLPPVQFERLVLHEAVFDIVNEAAQTQFFIGPLDLDAHIDSLLGPFRGDGQLRLDDGIHNFHFTSAGIEDDKIRFKWIAEALADVPRMEFDGALIFSHDATFAWSLDGKLSADHQSADAGWRAQGHVNVTAQRAKIEEIDWSPHSGEWATQMRGSMQMDFGPQPSLQAHVNAAFISAESLWMPSSSSALAALNQWLGGLRQKLNGINLNLTFDAQKVQHGGTIYSDVHVGLIDQQASTDHIDLHAAVADHSSVALNGDVELGIAPQFKGVIDIDSADFASLRPFLSLAGVDIYDQLASLPIAHIHARSDISISAAGFFLRGLDMAFGSSMLRGDAGVTYALGPERARLYADISAHSFLLGSWLDGVAGIGALSQCDLSLNVRADELGFIGVDGAIVRGDGHISLTRKNDVLDVADMSLHLADAAFSMNGFDHADQMHMKMDVKGERVLELARGLDHIFHHPLSAAFATRAIALSPFNLGVDLSGEHDRGDGHMSPTAVKMRGEARGTIFKVDIKKDNEGVGGQAVFDSADSALLLRQLGVDVSTPVDTHHAHIEMHINPWGAGYALTGDANVAGTTLSFTGHGDALWPASPLVGSLSMGGREGLDFDAHMNVSAERTHLSLDGISAHVAGMKMRGDGVWRFDGRDDEPVFKLNIQTDQIALSQLMSLMTGPASAPSAQQIWSTAHFTDPFIAPPRGLMYVQAQRCVVWDEWGGRDGRVTLAFAPNQLSLSDMQCTVSDGKIRGRMMLRRIKDQLSLNGTAELDHLHLSDARASAQLSALMDYTGQGVSPYDVMMHLNAAGRLSLDNLSVNEADPSALQRIIARFSEFNADETRFNSALMQELSLAPYHADYQEYVARLGEGRLRVLSATGALSSELTYDLTSRALDIRLPLSSLTKPRDWVGSSPFIISQWSGTPDHLTRHIDASALRATMAGLLVGRETARIDVMDFDLRERAFFERRLNGLRFLHQRQKEIAAFLAAHKTQASGSQLKAAPPKQLPHH